MPIARLETELCFALYSASNFVTNLYRPLLDPYGLTYTQFIVLMALWDKEDVTITSLADKLGLSKSTMTPLLKRLEEKSFIERRASSESEREKRIVLTDAGRELSFKSAEITGQAFCGTGISREDAGALITLCQKIISPATELA